MAAAAAARPDTRTVVERARASLSTYPAREAAWDARYFGQGAPELTTDRLRAAADEVIADGRSVWEMPRTGTVPPAPWPDPDLYRAIDDVAGPRRGLDTLANRAVLKLRPGARDQIAAELRRRGHAIYRAAAKLLGRIANAPDPARFIRDAVPDLGDWPGWILVGLIVYATTRRR